MVIVGSSIDATFCDVYEDGIINAKDSSAVAIAQKSITPNGDQDFDPKFDVNRDGYLTQDDVNLVNDFFGETIEYYPAISIGAGIYYIEIGQPGVNPTSK